MYTHSEEKSVEKVCFENEHICKNIELTNKQFEKYFSEFIESGNNSALTHEKLEQMAENFGIDTPETKVNITERYNKIINEAIAEFEKDREKYLAIMNKDVLEAYEEDVNYFKEKVLRNECPVIHSTLQNKKAKQLDKYRKDFNIAKANELLEVVANLCNFSERYIENNKNNAFTNVKNYKELELDILDTDEYTAYGVIGGGIKSMLLYKMYPEFFSYRSREAIWSLWYLTNKEVLDCTMDSEFIMIDTNKTITQQNYFYPYCLFSFYALNIFYLLNQKAKEYNVVIPIKYRYVIVDAFMSFVARTHQEEIDLYTRNIGEDSYYGV